MKKAELDAIEEAFKYHPPKNDETVEMHSLVRQHSVEHAVWLFDNLPYCDERKEAVKKVREAMYWANAAIAIHGVVD